MLDRPDRARPLFLFINIVDAHVPYPPIPDGVGWVPARPPFDMHWEPTSAQHRYVTASSSLRTTGSSWPKGLVAHGQDVWESVVRVPFLVLTNEGPVRMVDP
jgi:hypothetical protein